MDLARKQTMIPVSRKYMNVHATPTGRRDDETQGNDDPMAKSGQTGS